MKNKKIVPKLRFPEFFALPKWEPKTLGEICKSFSGGTPATTKKEYYGGTIPFIRSAEIDKDCTELFLTESGLKNSSAKLVKKGSVLVALYGANSGEVALCKINGAINQAILCLQSNQYDAFIYYFLLFKKSWIVETYIQGGQGNLSGEIIKSISIPFPSFKEQQKIADCLSSLDDLITAHTKKLDHLKTHKKGLMQQLFPAEGETVPKLRFPEFRDAGEWEVKPIEQLLTIGSGRDYKHLSNGDVPVYGTGGYMLSVDDYLYDGESVCIGRKGTIDKPIFLTGKFWTVDTLFYTHSFKDCLPTFIYLCFQNINWLEYNEASGVPSLSKVIINKIELGLPSLKEQQKIAACLSSLDDRITAQTQKIEALKLHKKGLMQQLLPTTDEVDSE